MTLAAELLLVVCLHDVPIRMFLRPPHNYTFRDMDDLPENLCT